MLQRYRIKNCLRWLTTVPFFVLVTGPLVEHTCLLQLSLGSPSHKTVSSFPTVGSAGRNETSVLSKSLALLQTFSTVTALPGRNSAADVPRPSGDTLSHRTLELPRGHEIGIGMLETMRSRINLLEGEWTSKDSVIVACGVVFAILFFCYMYGAKAIGESVVLVIENLDKDLIGVDVEIGSSSIDPESGKLKVCGLVVRNPKGYKSEFLLKADCIFLDLNTYALACTCGRSIDVQSAKVSDVIINLERSMLSSNADDVLRFVADHAQLVTGGGISHEQKPIAGTSALRAKWKNRLQNTKDMYEMAHAHKVTLHEFHMEDIKVNICATALGGRGIPISIPDIRYADFDKEINEHNPIAIIHHLLGHTLNATLRGGRAVWSKEGICSHKSVCSAG